MITGRQISLASRGVHRAKVFGRCEVKSGIAPVDRFVGEVMGQEPYLCRNSNTACLPLVSLGASALPFNWTFTRCDFNALLAKIALKRLAPAA